MSSFNEAIKNILNDIFGSDDKEEVLRPRARPEGVETAGLGSRVLRPKARPEDIKPVDLTPNQTVAESIKIMSGFEDTPEEGVNIPLAKIKADARNLDGRYNTSAMEFYRRNKDAEGATVSVKSVEEDTALDDFVSEVQDTLAQKPYQLGQFKPNYKRTKKDEIMEVQQALNARGITVNDRKLVVDGIRGGNTIKAIKSFQKEEGLKIDGIAGKNTKYALLGAAPIYEVTQSGLSNQAEINAAQEATEQRSVMENLSMAAEAYEAGDMPMFIGETDQGTKEGRVRIQEALNELGYDVGKADGIFGPKTKKQIQKFKGDNGLLSSLNKGGLDVDINKDTAKALNDARNITMGGDNETPDVVKDGIFVNYPGKKLINLVTSTPAKLLIKNILGLDSNFWSGKPIPITETSFKKDELQHYRNMWNKFGEGLVTKGKQIPPDAGPMDVMTGKDRSSVFDLQANVRAYYSVGDTNLSQEENGDVILTDKYDYNLYTDYTAEPTKNEEGELVYPNLKTEEFESEDSGFTTAKGIKDTIQAYTNGKIGFMSVAHNMGFLLGSRDYKDASKNESTPIRINLGNPETWGTDNAEVATGQGLMSPTTTQPTAISEGQEFKVNNLTIVNATRGDGKAYLGTKDMFNISLDYNSHTSYASGTEVIIPDNADKATRKAADKFNKAMVAFAKKHGIKGYKNRGIFTTSQNAARKGGERGGVSNTVHVEPFFIQDKKMVAIVNNNFEEFSKIYVDTFGSLPARMVAPHGVGSDVGRSSEEFGNETEFGRRVIATLMGS